MEETTLESPSMEQTIADSWEQISQEREVEPEQTGQLRDETGKFTKAQQEQEQEQTTQQVEQVEELQPEQQEEQQVEGIKAPSSYTKEAQEKFATADPLLQQQILKREEDFHKGIEGYKEWAGFGQDFARIVQPFMQTIQQLGATPTQAAEQLFKADHQLRYGNDQQKLQMVEMIFNDYGITPEAVANYFQNRQAPDPRYQELEQQVRQVTAQQQQWLTSQQQQQAEALNSEIQAFAQGKDHFEAVRGDMSALLRSGAATTLQEAYEKAVWANPSTRQLEMAKQQKLQREKEAEAAAKAKQTSSVNVQKKGVLPAQKPLGSIDETIREAAERLGLA